MRKRPATREAAPPAAAGAKRRGRPRKPKPQPTASRLEGLTDDCLWLVAGLLGDLRELMRFRASSRLLRARLDPGAAPGLWVALRPPNGTQGPPVTPADGEPLAATFAAMWLSKYMQPLALARARASAPVPAPEEEAFESHTQPSELTRLFVDRRMTASCAELLRRAFGVRASEMGPALQGLIQRAAECGVFDVAAWGVDAFGLAWTRVSPRARFVDACREGHRDAARWLAGALRVAPGEFHGGFLGDPSESGIALVGVVCRRGHVAVAEWLTAEFFARDAWWGSQPGRRAAAVGATAGSHDEAAFLYLLNALWRHELEAAKWVLARFPKAARDLRARLRTRRDHLVLPFVASPVMRRAAAALPELAALVPLMAPPGDRPPRRRGRPQRQAHGRPSAAPTIATAAADGPPPGLSEPPPSPAAAAADGPPPGSLEPPPTQAAADHETRPSDNTPEASGHL